MINPKKKSLYKSITWPFVHIFFVGGLLYIVTKLLTGEAEWEYIGIGAISYLAVEMSFYYLHEKIWDRVKGK
jgi:hypothetical protein